MTKPVIHLYCDESCHLEFDAADVMVLGALWCDASTRGLMGRAIKRLKALHRVPAASEGKWTKVSPSLLEFYTQLIDLFFDSEALRFRAVVVPGKQSLRHVDFNQTHDDFYYKMWWQVIDNLIDEEHCFRIFLDVKDTRGAARIRKLEEVLRHSNLDFDKSIIQSVELVRSHDVPLMQLVDVLTGAIGYANRGLTTSEAKFALVQHIRNRSRHTLVRSTLPRARKLNVFVWRGR